MQLLHEYIRMYLILLKHLEPAHLHPNLVGQFPRIGVIASQTMNEANCVLGRFHGGPLRQHWTCEVIGIQCEAQRSSCYLESINMGNHAKLNPKIHELDLATTSWPSYSFKGVLPCSDYL